LFGCNTPDPTTLAISCPATSILAQAASVTKMRPGGNQPANAILTAYMEQAELACDYDMEDNSVDVDVRFPITVTRGPAGAGAPPQTLDYFVAVTDAAGTVLSKHIFHRQVDLGGKMSVKLTEEVDGNHIGLGADKKPYEYQIMTGFQLTRAELSYNQTNHNSLP
jgi:hypothetical protein